MPSLGAAKVTTPIDHILQRAVEMGATDIHLQGQEVPRMRLQGVMVQYGEKPIDNAELAKVVLQVLTVEQRKFFQEGMNVDVAWELPRLGRYRFNFSRSQGKIVIAIRIIPIEVPSFDQLNLPPILQSIANYRRGLVLVVGTTGSGKSTTLAAMIGHISSTQKCHVISIEDPIEYIFPKGTGLITQKEVGRDVPSYADAMRSVLRQDPDVIVIGEMRDRETIETALLAAETGHFVISTLHTLDAAETIHRILSAYPAQQQVQVRQQLASILRAVVALRLVPKLDGSGVVPAVEVLINNDRIREMIAKPDRIHEISTAIEESFEGYGMRTFDQSLMDLLSRGQISYDTAITTASRPGLFDLRASGISSMGGEKKWANFEQKKQGPAAKEKQEQRDTWLETNPSDETQTAVSYEMETVTDIQPNPPKRPKYDRRRYQGDRPSEARDAQIWLMSSLLGILTGLFLWWSLHDRSSPINQNAGYREPVEVRTYSSGTTRTKYKARRPTSSRRLRAIEKDY